MAPSPSLGYKKQQVFIFKKESEESMPVNNMISMNWLLLLRLDASTGCAL
jgi:hypothetical protein